MRAVQRVLRKVVNASPGSAAPTEDFTSDRGELYYFTNIAGTELAVKRFLIRTDKSHVDSEWRLVNRELEAARLASHRPGLVPVVDHAHLDDRLLVVMPRAERSLAAAIRAGVTPEEAAAAIGDSPTPSISYRSQGSWTVISNRQMCYG